MSTEYRVRLEAFEGPLDLLLFLIRRAEVDIHDIPVATIADQYVEHLSGLERIDIDLAGEFLLMAATLMEIKSRLISPHPTHRADAAEESGGAPADDPRADLVKQLLEYKAFRDAASRLEERRAGWEKRFPSRPIGVDAPRPDDEGKVLVEDLELVDIVEAFGRIMRAVNFDRLGEHTVTWDDTPIEIHAEDVLDQLRQREPAAGPMRLVELFQGRTRPEMVGLFLAILELVRDQRVRVKQEVREGEAPLPDSISIDLSEGRATNSVP